MRVKDLIKQLVAANPEAIVVLARDEEGNGFSPAYVAAVGQYVPGESVGFPGKFDCNGKPANAVCLWPNH